MKWGDNLHLRIIWLGILTYWAVLPILGQTLSREESRLRIERIKVLMEQNNVTYPVRVKDGMITCKAEYGEIIYIKADGSGVVKTGSNLDRDYSEGLTVVLDDQNGACFLDRDGNQVAPWFDTGEGQLSRDGFHEGLLAVTNLQGKIGFMDRRGKMVIAYQYENPPEFSYFSEGLAPVEREGRFGFINKTGKLVIPLIYNHVRPFSGGKSLVKKANEEFWIDSNGQRIEEYDSKLSEGVYFPHVSGKDYRIAADKNNRQAFPGHFSNSRPFSEGLAWVCSTDTKLWGVIDHSGNMVVPFQYAESGFGFENGYSVITANRTYGLIDKQGNMVMPCVSTRKPELSDGLVVISVGRNQHGVMDLYGNATCQLPTPNDPTIRPNIVKEPEKPVKLRVYTDNYQTKEELAEAVTRIISEVYEPGLPFHRDVDYTTVLPIMERAGNMGIVDAQIFLYDYHMWFAPKKPRDYPTAKKWLDKAIAANDVRAWRYLGDLWRQQDGVRAFSYYKKAASMGDVRSIVIIADGYSKEKLDAEDDWTRFMNRAEAFKWWMKGAELGEASCIYEVGMYLLNGDGVAKDEKHGWAYIKKAADMGWGPAESTMRYRDLK